MTGLFITMEGVEGCGKSTQTELLRQYLADQGREVIVTREPGGTPIAEAIRALLLDPENRDMGPVAELLLYEAARAQHVDERIRPALAAGAVVLSDRFADSTTAYQGAGRCLDRDVIRELHQIATRGVWPQLTIVIDIPADEGLRRVSLLGPGDRIEREQLAFHERVRAGFLEIAAQEPERVRVVDGARAPEEIAGDIRALVASLLGEP